MQCNTITHSGWLYNARFTTYWCIAKYLFDLHLSPLPPTHPTTQAAEMAFHDPQRCRTCQVKQADLAQDDFIRRRTTHLLSPLLDGKLQSHLLNKVGHAVYHIYDIGLSLGPSHSFWIFHTFFPLQLAEKNCVLLLLCVAELYLSDRRGIERPAQTDRWPWPCLGGSEGQGNGTDPAERLKLTQPFPVVSEVEPVALISIHGPWGWKKTNKQKKHWRHCTASIRDNNATFDMLQLVSGLPL